MKAKHRKTLAAMFARPTPANIAWVDVAALLQALGAELEEREGSRVAVVFPGRHPHVLHKPHPRPQLSKAMVTTVRQLLESEGIEP